MEWIKLSVAEPTKILSACLTLFFKICEFFYILIYFSLLSCILLCFVFFLPHTFSYIPLFAIGAMFDSALSDWIPRFFMRWFFACCIQLLQYANEILHSFYSTFSFLPSAVSLLLSLLHHSNIPPLDFMSTSNVKSWNGFCCRWKYWNLKRRFN